MSDASGKLLQQALRARLEHRLEDARRDLTEAVALYRAQGKALRLAHAVRHLGDIHRNEGRLDLADPCYYEALTIYRSHHETPPLDLANAIRGFALLKEGTGEVAQAASLWEEAGQLYASVHVREGVAESSRRVALLAGDR